MKKRYFHEVIEEDEKILAIGLKQSRLHKKERLDRELEKEKSLHEVLMAVSYTHLTLPTKRIV